ncbi:MAG: EamA family transporter [Syntrophobacteraceae bacterium]|jgi:drug/metabolite transporter (DMT)-like permease
MKTTFVITLAVITQAVANTLLSKGMKVIASMPSFSDGFSLIMLAYALKSPFIWGGIVLLIVFFACFLSAVSWADLSLVLPITALGYILNVFSGSYFLDERVSLAHWFGSVLIVLGVFLVSLSGARKDKIRGSLPKSGEPGPGGVAC